MSSDVTYWFLFWCGCQPLIPRNVEAKKRIPPSCFSPLPFISHTVFTAEQYQQHQEQLALMQKQQLEQSEQQQQQANIVPTTTNTQVSVDRH